ncbi:MAG: hypothetical protein PHT94_00720 [Candidatus Nanoarchaeia archaeon]|nr:hypothetical protein [Candidatus Nanoarchaeia archaeon]
MTIYAKYKAEIFVIISENKIFKEQRQFICEFDELDDVCDFIKFIENKHGNKEIRKTNIFIYQLKADEYNDKFTFPCIFYNVYEIGEKIDINNILFNLNKKIAV